MLTHWNHINRLLNDFADVAGNTAWPAATTAPSVGLQACWAATDVRESDEALTLTMDVPGLSSDDVQVIVEDRVLKITGSRPKPKSEEVTIHRAERRFGSFSRSFRLGPKLNPSETTADVAEGVLTVSIPKSPESKALHVEVL